MPRPLHVLLLPSLALVVGVVSGLSSVPSFSSAVEAPRCQGADLDIELCIVAGVRKGTFVLQDSAGTTVVSIPSDPSSCPDQTFEVALEYPTAKPLTDCSERAAIGANADRSSLNELRVRRRLRRMYCDLNAPSCDTG